MSKIKTISIKFEVDEQLLKDLLTTCVEGGSRYWLACDSYKRDPITLDVLSIKGCVDAEDDTEKFGNVSLRTMLVGLKRIAEGTVSINDTSRKNLMMAIADKDSCDWDADDADAVLQAGLLNSIVYG